MLGIKSYFKKAVNGFRSRLAVKMTASIVLLLLLVSGIFSLSGYWISTKLSAKLEDQFVLRLTTNIQNVTNYLAVIPDRPEQISDTKHQAYERIKKQFEAFKKEDSLENVYVLMKKDNKEQIIVLTGVEDDYGTEYPFTPEMNEAVKQDKPVISSIYTDEYGIHKSIFAPLRNQNGENIGIVGIDLDATVIPQTKQELVWTMIMITLLILLLGSLIAYFISRSVTRPVVRLMHMTEKVAAGDLSERVHIQREDEIGKLAEAFNVMRENLDILIRQMFTSANMITQTSEQLYHSADESSSSAGVVAVSMNNMYGGVAEVVSSITDSTTSIFEINGELTEVTSEVKQMQLMAHQVGAQSVDGQQLVEKTLHQMNVIQKEMKQSEEAAQQLGNRSKEIGEIIHIITEIAQQTNLLALNASIEAARVGEQGKGFAVVAGEVKKLAEQSTRAASSITDLVSSTQNDSLVVMASITQGNQAVEQGQTWIHDTYENFKIIFNGISMFSERTDRLLDTLERAVQSFETISAVMQRISGITEEQSAGYEEVAAAAEEQSASIQEITAAIRNLSEMAAALQGSVQKFNMKQ
ncbi:methyl-accepting chemotaxis protein [Paenibacillus sp. GCM10023248]|uniref:methyl-accepting chemotaxis protein n=1 Tax=unclassified Paenibacillus TaxID=185978 RepID=UPI002379913C|nr:methyl-accepting chemotaxis protein [Paenibacillus sp. MAHUQ-63]MDD9267449.1 methyl-accepting chemotaxis protein [Paenibacillus sp. MAHUQ-63]